MDEIEEMFDEWGIKEIYAKVKNMARPSVKIDLQKQRGNVKDIFSSRIGGSPVMLPSDEWPVDYGGKPQIFVGQINLEDASKYDETNMLPKKGILLFFHSPDLESYGSVSENSKQFKVLFLENTDGLELRDCPEDMDACDVKYSMSFSKLVTFPSDRDEEIDAMEMDEEEADSYHECAQIYNHQMLGYACELQSSMEWECALATAGYSFDMYNSEEEGVKAALAKEKDWILLCQFLSTIEAMPWGDDGQIYFWITKQDLVAKNFNKVWCVMQFT